ncbi:MAG: hypothetical protein IPM25_19425 [Chloracidobacterium sp.]|nr:hypothetical protein [Chloracidobacterium sp.]
MNRCILLLILALAALVTVSNAQNRFDGYSLTVNADATGACPIRFLPQQNQANHIEVFLAGTGMTKPATGLSACNNSTVSGNRVAPSPQDQRWCFEGPEEMYEIRLSNGKSYLWPTASGREMGFYNVKDFRPVRRSESPNRRYEYSEPSDHTTAIENAMMVMASRQGGTLVFPEGDYIVGTTDGNTRDPSFDGITIPTGVTILGAAGNYSIPTTNMPGRISPTRIRLRNNRQAIFKIGGCTNAVTIRNVELMGNSALYGEGPRDRAGTRGIVAAGKWAIDPRTKQHTVNPSQYFRIENVVFQNFETGFVVRNLNQENCNAAEQMCNQWQFDNVRVDHGVFINNNTGISIDTFNTDWTIANSQFNYLEANAPGIGIHVKRGAAILIENTFGGGYDYERLIGGTFLQVESVGSITLVSVSSERSRRSIFTAAATTASSQMMTVIGSVFNDLIELNGRMNFASFGNRYFGSTMKTAPQVVVNSVGDKFCHDPLTFPGHCTDRVGGGNPVNRPGFNGGTIMFRSGRLPEGEGRDLIDREPNYFGYDVEIGKGLVQFDPNITFRDLAGFVSPENGSSRVKDGAMVYCKDCRKTAAGICSQGQASTDGAFAKRINGQWRCD